MFKIYNYTVNALNNSPGDYGRKVETQWRWRK